MSDNWIDESDICFITGKIMSTQDRARFTFEFDAWVSEEGQQLIEDYIYDRHTAGLSDENNYEYELIYGEWYAKDAASAGRAEDYMEADANNDEFRRWHK